MKTQLENLLQFLVNTKIGYLIFFTLIGFVFWSLITLFMSICSIDFELSLLPYMCGFMVIGLFNIFTIYRKLPWGVKKSQTKQSEFEKIEDRMKQAVQNKGYRK